MISNEKEILLNIMYTGKYLTDGNIGHEVINLFKDDKKQNYIYILPVGTIGEIHDDKVEVILLVKRCNACLLEILAKAEGLKKIGTKKDEQKQYIENEDIRYGHVLLPEIFEGNVENGNYVTFRAENVIKAAQPIFITTDEILSKAKGYYFVGDIKFPLRQKGYVSDKKHAETYKILQGIIKEKTNWGEETKTLEDYEDFLQNKRNAAEHDFISIIKKDYDELVFSNLFQYIFSSCPEGFNLFVKEVLQADIKFSDNFVVEREKENMDLFNEGIKEPLEQLYYELSNFIMSYDPDLTTEKRRCISSPYNDARFCTGKPIKEYFYIRFRISQSLQNKNNILGLFFDASKSRYKYGINRSLFRRKRCS